MVVEIAPVRYHPPDARYRLDVEVIGAAELRRRVEADPQRGFERVDFQCVVFVRSGTYTHTIDFESHRCAAGSCLLIGPGQVHLFGPPSSWDGWIVVVGPHLVPREVERLPPHIRTDDATATAITELCERMTDDASSHADPAHRNELLALQVRVLLRRLLAGVAEARAERLVDQVTISRYRAFKRAVDEHYRHWHLVAPYSQHLGCSSKSLNRACQAVSDATAKRLIVERIILEAKRLLGHGTDPVAKISAELGFDEATNFVKYFKRETGLTPARFRAETGSADP